MYHPPSSKQTTPPAGFAPVFINYVGRHGARFLTKPGSDVLILDVLQQAAIQNALTTIGKQVQQTVVQFERVEKGNYENITMLGAGEQKGIGARMYRDYKRVFTGKGVDVWMTAKVRTQQSADAFLDGLALPATDPIRRTIASQSTDTILRFYDLSPAYDTYLKSKSLQQHLDSLRNDPVTSQVANRICSKIFKPSFLQQLIAKKLVSNNGTGKQAIIDAIAFSQALYDVYAIWFSAVTEMQQDCRCQPENSLQKAFTKDDLQWLDQMNSAEDFYTKGPADNATGTQVTIAAPLLANFINTTDSIVNGTKQVDAVLRFTHAEAISPFATLLGIPEASQTNNSVYQFQKQWQASQIIPLSATIQWILYSNGKQYLVKVLLNEKEVKLPVATQTYPYYNWQKVKQYYTDLLTRIDNLSPGTTKD